MRPEYLRHCLAASGVAVLAMQLAGCATSAPDPALSLAPAADAPSVSLPETVALLPSSADSERMSFAAGTAEAATAFAYASPAPSVPIEPPASGFGPSSGVTAGSAELDALIARYADHYQVPVDLVRRVVRRESTFNPRAYHRGHWGLMQINHATARGMGYDGPANGLLDAETNLRYAVKYLRGAWLVAGGDEDRADRLYQSGYYYQAKSKGLLEETGLGVDRRRHRATGGVIPVAGQVDMPDAPVSAPVPAFASAKPGA